MTSPATKPASPYVRYSYEDAPQPEPLTLHRRSETRGFRSATSTFGVTMAEVLAKPSYRSAFVSYLESVDAAHNLYFVDAVNKLVGSEEHERVLLGGDSDRDLNGAGAASAPANSRMLRRRQSQIITTMATVRITCRGIFRKFIEESDKGGNKGKVDVGDDTKQQLRDALKRLSDSNKSAHNLDDSSGGGDDRGSSHSLNSVHSDQGEAAANDIAVVKRLFRHARDHVFMLLERQLFAAFQGSDEYVDMMVHRMDGHDEEMLGMDGTNNNNDSNNSAAGLKDGNSSSSSSSGSSDKAAVAKKLVKTMARADSGWVNEMGYQSVGVDVLEARCLRAGYIGGKPDPYVVVTVDSADYRTDTVSGTAEPSWRASDRAHFEFPLRNTTQYVEFNVFDRNMMGPDKHLGRAMVHISKLIRRRFKHDAAVKGNLRRLATLPELGSHASATGDGAEDDENDDQNSIHDEEDSGEDEDEDGDGESKTSSVDGVNDDGMDELWLPLRKTTDTSSGVHKERGELHVRVKLSQEQAAESTHGRVSSEQTSVLADFVRHKVSKKKKRFVKDGFDLDLTYITDRVIAMGFPSVKLEGVYRNNMATVKAFFNKRHPHHYKVYNLCIERSYDPSHFDGMACRYGFEDHNPCPFGMINDFCRDVHAYLSEHPQHIAAIHCKAGKGRTGLLISCYMLYTRLFPNALASLKFYAARRTKNSKGVTIPSQIRYVHYYDRYLHFERMVAKALSIDQAYRDLKQEELEQLQKDHNNDEKTADDGTEKKQEDVNDKDESDNPRSGSLVRSNSVKEEHMQDEATQNRISQEAAQFALGFRGRTRSVWNDKQNQMDVLDYLHARNTAAGTDDDSRKGSYLLPDEDKNEVYLRSITIHGIPHACKGSNLKMWFKLRNDDQHLRYHSGKEGITPEWDRRLGTITFKLPEWALLLKGDIQVQFYHSGALGFGNTKMFQFWVNTRFIIADDCHAELTKPELDKANKDTKHKQFPPGLKVHFQAALPKGTDKRSLYTVLNSVRDIYARFASLGINTPEQMERILEQHNASSSAQ